MFEDGFCPPNCAFNNVPLPLNIIRIILDVFSTQEVIPVVLGLMNILKCNFPHQVVRVYGIIFELLYITYHTFYDCSYMLDITLTEQY